MTPLLNAIAGLLILLAVVNLYFVWHGFLIYRSITPRSPILLALWGVKVTVWLIGVFIAWVAFRSLLSLPPLPLSGLGIGVCLILLELLPSFIWTQVRRFVKQDLRRDVARDLVRDEIRDPARDLARDKEHDEAT